MEVRNKRRADNRSLCNPLPWRQMVSCRWSDLAPQVIVPRNVAKQARSKNM